MKKKGKIILTVVLVLAIAAVAAAVAAFRPQPVLDPSGTYEVQRVNYWLEGPNLEWEGYLHTMPTPEQAQETALHRPAAAAVVSEPPAGPVPVHGGPAAGVARGGHLYLGPGESGRLF